MKAFDFLRKNNNLFLLAQRTVALFFFAFFMIMMNDVQLAALGLMFVGYFIVQLIPYGFTLSVKANYYEEAKVGNHKHEFRLMIIATIYSLVIIAISSYIVPTLVVNIGLDSNVSLVIYLIYGISMIKAPVKEYLRTKIREDVISTALGKERVTLIGIVAVTLLLLQHSDYLFYITLVLLFGHVLELILLMVHGVIHYPEHKYKVLYEDSQKHKQLHLLNFAFLKNGILTIALVALLSAIIYIDLTVLNYEIGLYVISVFLVVGVISRLLTYTSLPYLDDIKAKFEVGNFSGVDKLLQVSLLKVLVVTIPLIAFTVVFYKEINQIFSYDSYISLFGVLVVLLIPSLQLVLKGLIETKHLIEGIIIAIIALIVKLLLNSYMISLLGLSGLLMVTFIVQLIIIIGGLFIFNLRRIFEGSYFIRNLLKIVVSSLLFFGVLYLIRLLLADRMLFDNTFIYNMMLLVVSGIILSVLVYAMLLYTGLLKLFMNNRLSKEDYLYLIEEKVIEEILW